VGGLLRAVRGTAEPRTWVLRPSPWSSPIHPREPVTGGAVTDIAATAPACCEIVQDKAIVHGRVTLSSGREADYYVDLRRITLDGEASPLVGRVMRDLTADLDFDAVGGLTLGADPVATAMLHAAAAGWPPRRLRRAQGRARPTGCSSGSKARSIAGRRVLIVEDTSTTGCLAPGGRPRPPARPAPPSSRSPRSPTGRPGGGRGLSPSRAGVPARLRIR
jgi:orotate phosphoribosyltransferase